VDVDRRQFLKQIGCTLLGGGVLISIVQLTPSSGKAAEQPLSGSSPHLYGYIVNSFKCIGCGKCVEACKIENHVPERFFRTWVERYRITADGTVHVDSPDGAIRGFPPHGISGNVKKGFFVPKLCNHCARPNCVQVCPVGATYVSPEGVVLVDEKHCVGCSYCVQACPYGARYIHPVRKTADKCTWCYHRIIKGLAPACVLVCPAQARLFGDLNDPLSTVSKVLINERANVLKPDIGNEPKTFYVGLAEEVR
jgi:tetrathionate reductase subunit B